MKKIALTFVLLLFSACGSKQLYTFGDTSKVESQTAENQSFIAVEKVLLPIYFMDSPIYEKSSSFHLQKIDEANWIHSMDQHLTNVLIAYLQKSMNNPNIYGYPWSNIKQLDKKLSLNITEFIAYKGVLTLEANYQILDKKNHQSHNYLFQTKISMNQENIESMLSAMEEAYFKLAEEIRSKL